MRGLAVVVAIIFLAGGTDAATSVTRHAITWTFDADYTTGTFVNGDPWVKENIAGGGVTVTGISPEPGSDAGGAINGSMVNPAGNAWAPQGYDERGAGYSASSNIFSSGGFPKTIAANSSLISSQSYNVSDVDQERPVVADASVLTVLAADVTPGTGDFRPPYVGTDKSLDWNSAGILWDRLPGLASPPQVALVPGIDDLLPQTERLWLLNSTVGNGRDIHPKNNMPEYGRDLSNRLEEALLRSLLDDPQADLEQLVVQLIQIGIDIAGCVHEGITYSNNGGHNQGMKMPVLYAGRLLNDTDMIAMGDKEQYFIFQEDQQTFYVSQTDVDDCPKYTDDGRPRECYTADMIGMPEWGEKHTGSPQRDGSNWNAYYRDVSGTATNGHCLTAILMGLEDEWNWPPFFDYYRTRYVPTEIAGAMSNFEKVMWTVYGLSTGVAERPAAVPAGAEGYVPLTLAETDVWRTELIRSGARLRVYSGTGVRLPGDRVTCPGLYIYRVYDGGTERTGRMLVVR